jgi:hypothetical protein
MPAGIEESRSHPQRPGNGNTRHLADAPPSSGHFPGGLAIRAKQHEAHAGSDNTRPEPEEQHGVGNQVPENEDNDGCVYHGGDDPDGHVLAELIVQLRLNTPLVGHALDVRACWSALRGPLPTPSIGPLHVRALRPSSLVDRTIGAGLPDGVHFAHGGIDRMNHTVMQTEHQLLGSSA